MMPWERSRAVILPATSRAERFCAVMSVASITTLVTRPAASRTGE